MLAALVLTLRDDARGQVRDADRRVGLVDVLTARPRGPVGVYLEILLVDLDLDVPASVASGRIKSEVPLSGMLRAELSEREVARLAAFSETLAAPVREVRLEEGYIVVRFGLEALGARVPVGVEGEAVLRDGGELGFEADRLEVLGERLPKRLTQRLLEDVDFAYPIELPFEGELSEVDAHNDRLVLTGGVSNLSAG